MRDDIHSATQAYDSGNGYVYIRPRKTDPASILQPEIPGSAWVACVATEPAVHLLSEEEIRALSFDPRDYESYPAFAEWERPGKETVCFHWVPAHVDVHRPDEETLAMMLRMAHFLGARVSPHATDFRSS